MRLGGRSIGAAAKRVEPVSRASFSDDFREAPYWQDGVEAPIFPHLDGDARVDVAIVGSGYTGLNAALETARGGRSTLVLDAGQAGWGCSTRNGGQISTSVKPDVAKLARRFGLDRARAIHREGAAALEWIGQFVCRESIDCDFRKAGRFHAAHSPTHYELLARSINDPNYGEDTGAFAVPRDEQRSELGTGIYHGGVVYPRHSALHPAKYHRGLLDRVAAAGADIRVETPVIAIERAGKRHVLTTPRGRVSARDVIVATNGYTGAPFGWLRRRIVPIGSYIIATEELPRGLIDRLFPTDRIASDTRRVVYYYRASPDRQRVVFGGRVSSGETDPKISGPRLHAEMVRIFPELASSRISHSWNGTVAYSFDELAHTGTHDGVHYALGYCGSGVSMASYLGMRVGQRVLGKAEGATAFDDLPFPTRPFYRGRPWFLPAIVAGYRWLDNRELGFDRKATTDQ